MAGELSLTPFHHYANELFMLVRYRIPVEHDGSASNGLQFEWEGATYKFNVKNGSLFELEVLVASFPREAIPTFTPSQSNDGLPTLTVPQDPLWPAVEKRLMFVEGAVALMGLRRFHFDRRTTEWIPESQEEKDSSMLRSFSAEKTRNKTKIPVAFDMFARSLIISEELASLEVALNFNRRGRESLGEGRYIEAIYEFYFVIETLFADGRFRKRKVLAQFEEAEILRDAVLESQNELAQDPQFIRLGERVQLYLKASVKTVLEQMFEVRGFLHHHSSKRASVWHPERQEAHHVDAIFFAQVCFSVLGRIVFGSMYSRDSVDKFTRVNFTNEQGARIKFVAMDFPD